MQNLSKVVRQGDLQLGDFLVHQLFEGYARDTPDAIAISSEADNYSFSDLNCRANRLARTLLEADSKLGKDQLVALSLPRGDKLVVLILAIWKLGAAYVPIDAGLPAKRVEQMLENKSIRLLITESSHFTNYDPKSWDRPVRSLEELTANLEHRDSNLDVVVTGDDLAYVIFTSGTTGRPKGVMVEHLGMLNNILNKTIDFEITSRTRVAQIASLSFDVSVWQTFIALTTGGTTVIYSDAAVYSPNVMLSSFKQDCISLVEVVPSYLVLLLDHIREQLPSNFELPNLKHLILTGEIADPNLVRLWFDRFPGIIVVNAYGPTEASDDITHHIMRSADAVPTPIPVGSVLANFDIYVVDENLQPVPRGEKGEIVVTGAGVARGYLAPLTNDRPPFVASPFPDLYNGRLYRTGDVGCMLESGVMLFFGRRDHQVKIRGFRIELSEIESALLRNLSVRQAIAMEVKRPDRESIISAIIVAYGVIDERAIVEGLREFLPSYMIPAEFRFLTKLPLLISGKVDRKALADLF